MNREDQDHVDPSARRQPRRAKPHQPRPRRTSVFATPYPPTRRPPTHKGWPPQSSESSVRAHRHQYPDGRGARSVSASQPHEKNRQLPPVTKTHQVLGIVPLRKPGGTPHPQTDDQRRRSKHAQKTRHNRRGNNFRARVRMAHDKGWPQGHKRHKQRVATRPAQRVAPPQTGHTIGGGVEGGRGFFGVSTSLPQPPLPQPDQTIRAPASPSAVHLPRGPNKQRSRQHLLRQSICRASPTTEQSQAWPNRPALAPRRSRKGVLEL